MFGVLLYDFDCFDLWVNIIFQYELQESVIVYLQKFVDLDYVVQFGLIGECLLILILICLVCYSFILFECMLSGNQVWVQIDNIDQFFDINEGSKLELGFIVKLWVLVSYLEIVVQIYCDYGGMSVVELCKVEVELFDFIFCWGIDYLVVSCDCDFFVMFQVVMEWCYLVSFYESFFIGGGLYIFNNFCKEDNGCWLMLLEVLCELINLFFVCLLCDLICYDIYQNVGSKVQLLVDDKDLCCVDYFDCFVDKESQVYLCCFWVKYCDKDVNQCLEIFFDGLCFWLVWLVVIYCYLQLQVDLVSFSVFFCECLFYGSLIDKCVVELYECYGLGKFNFNDQGYVVCVYLLELWLFGYLQKQLQVIFGEVVVVSGVECKEVYGWLFKLWYKNVCDKCICILLEVEVFFDLYQ